MSNFNPLQRHTNTQSTRIVPTDPKQVISSSDGHSITFSTERASTITASMPDASLFSTKNVLNSDIPLKYVNPQVVDQISSNDINNFVTATSEYLDNLDNTPPVELTE